MANEVSLREANLTERQQIFVDWCAKGVGSTKAAELAGYAAPASEGSRTILLPHVQEAIRQATIRRMAGLSSKALNTLETLLEPEYPPAVRRQAADSILDRAGYSPATVKPGSNDKSMSEMTAAELLETMRQARAEMDKAKPAYRAPVSAEIIDVTPQNPNVD